MAEKQLFQLDFATDNIATLTLDLPDKGANVLSSAVLDELETHLDELEARDNLQGLIIRSGKPGMFIAGADLREFAQWIDADSEEVVGFCKRGHRTFGRLASCDFVTVAAIDGVCLGGGAELALWCDRRVMSTSPKCQYGFPEVKLGLFPGWGGTARTPRMVGLSNAIEMVTGGESVDGLEAYKLGLAQDLVASDRVDEAAVAMIRSEQSSRDFRRDRERWAAPIVYSETEMGFLAATASAYIQGKTKGQYPAPLAALEVMLGGAPLPLEEALSIEAEQFAEVFGSPVNRALLNVFFLQDRNKKDKGVDAAVEPRKVERVSVVGAGIMGQGIAAANIKRGVPVTLNDANVESLHRGVGKTIEEASFSKKIKGPDVKRAIELTPLLNGSTSKQEVAAADVVIEAIIENADAKRGLYASLEPLLSETAVLASNTSTIPITKLASKLNHPERFCGIHFFNPVRRMQLVEVIRGEQTSDETTATAVAYAKAIGKSPIVVADGPGFLVNRLLFPYMNESLELLLEGAPIKHVERAATAFGMPMGPIELFDMVGIDVCIHAGLVMYESFPDRMVAGNPLCPALYKAGRLGQKSGKGFFDYENKRRKPTKDEWTQQLIEKHRRDSKEFSKEEITNRLFLPMLLEATRVLEEKLVRDVRDVDLGLILGLGFPPFKGGLLFWADTLGAAKSLEMLEPLAPLGERYEPTDLLREMAASGTKFYELGET